MKGTIGRAREALRSADFRRLFAIRLVSQSADGLFQAALIASVVFSPEEKSTTVGFAVATLVVSLPFSVVGPFTGVFIDRWSRRRILVVAPLLRTALENGATSVEVSRMPLGLRNLTAYVIHYWGQTYAYVYVLTARYPYSGPPASTLEPEAAPA